VSPHQAAQLAVLPGIPRCLHTRPLSWQYCQVSRGVSTPGCSVGSTARYLAVSPHQAAQLAVLLVIPRCLHTRLLSWQYCRLSPGVSTPGCSVGSTARYLAVSPHQAAQLAVLPGISRCLHTRLLSWQYCRLSPSVSTPGRSVGSSFKYTVCALLSSYAVSFVFQKNVLSAFYRTKHHLKRMEPSITYCGHCQSMTAVTSQLLVAAVQNFKHILCLGLPIFPICVLRRQHFVISHCFLY
jgi:hypothetical protein